jgi:hypothetical protein
MTVPGPRLSIAVGPHAAPPRALPFAHVLRCEPGFDPGEHVDEPGFEPGMSSSVWQTGDPDGGEGARFRV